MRKRDKIRILKKTLKFLEHKHAEGSYHFGICSAILDVDDFPFRNAQSLGITLPSRRYGSGRLYCWPLNKHGAAIRRRVLKNAIKRLEK